MDDVEVVEHAPEEALRERAHRVGVARSDRRLHLLGLHAPRLVDQLLWNVASANDLPVVEVGVELRVVDHDADVAKLLRRLGQLRQHALDRGVEALHRPDLDDARGAVSRGDDRVGVGERDAHRLLDEDVEPGVESGQDDLRVRARG